MLLILFLVILVLLIAIFLTLSSSFQTKTATGASGPNCKKFCFIGIHYDNPHVALLQYKFISYFYDLEENTYILVSDLQNKTHQETFASVLRENGYSETIHFVPEAAHLKTSLAQPSLRNGESANFVLDAIVPNVLSSHEAILLLDGDLFPVEIPDLSVESCIPKNGYLWRQEGLEKQYMWVGFVGFGTSLPDIRTLRLHIDEKTPKMDAGANSHFYIKAHPDVSNYKVHCFPRDMLVPDAKKYDVKMSNQLQEFLKRDKDIAPKSGEVLIVQKKYFWFHLLGAASNWKNEKVEIIRQRCKLWTEYLDKVRS